jgi:thiol-disulfide isomerase/thioredoxin
MNPAGHARDEGSGTQAERPAATSRRGAIVGMAALATVAAGAGAAWWHRRANAAGELDALWSLRFERPEGGELALAPLRGRPLLINFWATWCAPCLRELPAIDQFHRRFQGQGWQVVGLAIDGPTPVRAFLARVKVGFPIGLAGLDGTDLVMKLGNPQGGLPFSVMIDRQGRLAQRKLGETSLDELSRWATAMG